MLNEQLQNELDQEAKAEAKKLTGRVPIFRMGYEAGHYDGAEKYAEKWQEAQQRCDHLEQWKKESKMLLDPILDWGQANKNVPLGASIAEEVLRRAKEYDELKAKVERYEKALKEIAEFKQTFRGENAIYDILTGIAREALTSKTGSDETING